MALISTEMSDIVAASEVRPLVWIWRLHDKRCAICIRSSGPNPTTAGYVCVCVPERLAPPSQGLSLKRRRVQMMQALNRALRGMFPRPH